MPREPVDHALPASVPVRRFRCTAPACGWQGLVPVSFDALMRAVELNGAAIAARKRRLRPLSHLPPAACVKSRAS